MNIWRCSVTLQHQNVSNVATEEEKKKEKEEKKFMHADRRAGGPIKGSTRGLRGPKECMVEIYDMPT